MKLIALWSAEEDHNRELGTSLIGQIVYKFCTEPDKSPSYVLSTTHIIGYNPSLDPNDPNYFTFTALSDGMTNTMDLSSLITRLNEGNYVAVTATALQSAISHKVPPA